MEPSIESISPNNNNNTLEFTLNNVNVSIANSLRRIILSHIPVYVMRTSPYEKNDANIIKNTTRFNNEVLKQRLSCIPLHINDSKFPYETFEIEVDAESLGGFLSYTDPNYNFLGNSINYFVSSVSSDKPKQGYENTVYSSGLNTAFEQYKNVFVNLGLSATYDDLQTQNSASASLKKQSGQFSEISGNYGFKLDTRNRAFMPTSGSILSFNQALPIYADKSFIENTFGASKYKGFSEDNIIGASKFFITSIQGLGDDDVRISKRKSLSTRKLRGFKRGKIGPVDGTDYIGGNYAAAINFEASLPNLLPESSKAEVGMFLDFGNVWGVDYDKTIDDSNKIRSAAGISTSYLSPIGPLTFVLSTNISKASTDETESFNFNLGTTF